MKKKFLAGVWKQTVVLFLSILTTLFLIEGAVRIRQWIKYRATGNTVYLDVVDPVSGLTVPMARRNAGPIRINSRGFRSPELDLPKPAGMIRLAFLGSSTTFCAEASSNETTWPHLVWRTLSDTWPDLKFDYANAGVPGYKVAESLRNLEYRVKPIQPDVIVIYDLINDLSWDTRELARSQGLFTGEGGEASALARWSSAWFLVEKNLQIRARQKRAAQGIKRLVFDPGTLSRGFYQRLCELVRASEKVAPVVALATFSHKVRRKQSPEEQIQACNTSLYYMPYMSVEGILKGFEAYNQVIREVARETDVLLVEAENAIPGDDRHFNDSVHFKDPGCELMARTVVDALVHSEAFKRLVDSRRTATEATTR